MKLKGERIFLRLLIAEDVDELFEWENHPDVKAVSDSRASYSRKDIEQFVNSHQDIYLQKQLRLMICEGENEKNLGCVDLFDFDASNARAGVGILIYDRQNRKQGFATEALELLTNYCARNLNLHQLYCNVHQSNLASLNLFKKMGFEVMGVKKEWTKKPDGWDDEIMLQKIIQT